MGKERKMGRGVGEHMNKKSGERERDIEVSCIVRKKIIKRKKEKERKR